MTKTDFGIIGLGVMGSSLAKNIADKGISLSVYNRTTPKETDVVQNFLEEAGSDRIQGHLRLVDFVASLNKPRKILIMVSAGEAVESVIDQLQGLLDPADIIMDGGNSHYEHTQRRVSLLAQNLIHFLGIGISGGEQGALMGPSIMVGGLEEAYEHVQPVLEAIAARDEDDHPCVALLGPDGSGHLVKTVHNGIEYAEMQLLAECFVLLSITNTKEQVAAIMQQWNETEIGSYLLGITVDILNKKEGDDFLLDKIVDMANSKGTGTWTSQLALQLGVPATMIHAAVNARSVSMLKEKRTQYSSLSTTTNDPVKIDPEKLRKAYAFARIINMHQGFALLKAASEENNWNLDLSEVARIWTEGCIIKSGMMNGFSEVLKFDEDIFKHPEFESDARCQDDLNETLMYALSQGVATPCLSAALQYWFSITSESSPANLIQAQRDYFGAHTYKRIDRPSSEDFTTNWNSNG